MPILPSGEQFPISWGDQRATIVEVGGGIRTYSEKDRPILDPYPSHTLCDGAHGAPLIPWPNRVADGHYQFDGNDYQLALTEPERHHAIHGLLRWRSWQAREHQGHRVVIATRLYPSPGYPFLLDVNIVYELGPDGLTVTTNARNMGETACPFACGQHPYLSPGGFTIDACTLEMAAGTHIVTNDRQIPIGAAPTQGTADDWSHPRPLGLSRLDDAFTDLARDDDGRAWVRLYAPDGHTVELWTDRSYPFLQIFSGDTLTPSHRRRSLAVEPMSAPANALQTGNAVVRLEPSQAWSGSWGVRLR